MVENQSQDVGGRLKTCTDHRSYFPTNAVENFCRWVKGRTKQSRGSWSSELYCQAIERDVAAANVSRISCSVAVKVNSKQRGLILWSIVAYLKIAEEVFLPSSATFMA